MRKKIFLISTTLMVTIILIIIIFQIITVAPTSSALQTKKFTKAICNETNFCQDYEIACESNKIIKINPIENASAQFSSEWQDPRNQEEIKKLCD
ncbi:MAG TPA: hypothetical protein VJB35_05390 [Candidatus Nanoarchaeia archaeon]|nr:hypothetical protein [Candidatus Nanoarchaeia archaeon]